ncbi:MAG TPA: hypothetical protein VK986_11160, partial [Tepidisphaeraceae bacterium]|nr:hypothetical protein [Tepidisphaeraceae bacterium]
KAAMNVRLKPEVERFVEEQVRAGRFDSSDELIEAAVARLMADPVSDELLPGEHAELEKSLAEMRAGQVVDWRTFSAPFRSKQSGQVGT